MKRKIYLLLILTISLLLILTGCKQKVEEKVAEKIIESSIESSTDGDVDLDIGDDITTIKTEQGITQMGSNIQWPKDKTGDLKELKTNITMVSEDKVSESIYIMYEGLKEDDAQKYLDSIKDLGYKSVYEVESSDGLAYIGNNENGFEVNFSYSNDGVGSISYSKSTMTEVNSFNAGDSSDGSLFTGDSPDLPLNTEDSQLEVDMTDDVPWPKDFFIEIPELEGKITGLSSNGNTEKDVSFEYVEKENAIDFVNKIKEAGFTESSSESVSGDYIEYQGYNSNQDYIIFVWNSDKSSSITLVKVE